ncbi:MAG: hypothetical protein JXR70_10640 [Spirochaetales bacterium]|nr:hypothetical protein [Spirochaetales bacterium]
MFDLNRQIESWADQLRVKGKMEEDQVLEITHHLEDEMDELRSVGLSVDEAFFIAVRRIGSSYQLSKEFAKINRNIIWKNLELWDSDKTNSIGSWFDLGLVVVLALCAGIFSKLPSWFGMAPADPLFKWSITLRAITYLKSVPLFVFPSILFYFMHKAGFKPVMSFIVTGLFGTAALVSHFYPSVAPFHSAYIISSHLFIYCWFLTGFLFVSGNWKNHDLRMDFVRLTGETFIYGVLISCGVFALVIFTNIIFQTIRVDISRIFSGEILYFLVFAIPVIAVIFADAKKSVIENMAPVLAKIFTPLFLVTMLVFTVVFFTSSESIFANRDILIISSSFSVFALALIFYTISARKPVDCVNAFDVMNFVLVAVAIVVDVIVLAAMGVRIGQYGYSINKVVSFGLNIIMLGNLIGFFVCYILFFINKQGYKIVEKFLTSYLIVYLGWSIVGCFVLPVVFGFQ